MPIRRLPTLLVNQIAAGEVIERPASVVKELVENSLDAGARRIDIAVEDGGRQLIRISDDGAGIPAEELPLALAPHATSKLESPEQLEQIATLGFRGEALASIASISRLRITSRATVRGIVAEAGAVMEAGGDQVGAVQPVAAAPGSLVEVRDLFFNTPARRKFMRAAPTEFGHIAELVSRIAMVRPDVGFSLSHNDRLTLEVAPTESRRQRCVEVLGQELDEALLEFEDHHGDMLGSDVQTGYRLWGLAGRPEIARATAKFQYVCINGRPIRDRQISHAIREAYRGLVPPDQQPVAVVFIDMPFEAVDVNVHPAKAEVRFRDTGRVHGMVLASLRQRLLGADLTPKAGFPQGGLTLGSSGMAAAANHGGTGDTASAPAANLSAASFVDYFRRMDPTQKGFVYQQVKEALAQDDPTAATNDTASGVAASLPLTQPSGNVPPALQAQGVLQVHQSYLVTQDEAGILIIDQHALHERVMFEELRSRILGAGRLESQRMLMPAVLNLSPARLAMLEQLGPLLEKLGIEVEPMGPRSAGIHAFPTFLFDRRVEPVQFMEDLLDRTQEGDFDHVTAAAGNKSDGPQQAQAAQESALHEVLDMMACKAAVKAGDHMSAEELASLLKQRDEIERSSNCPHGRPTTIRLSLRELEKQFKRT
ncbi:MAG: DNA mismatch repair endonuclease MutL [Phycisphaeraceae bacterium]